MTRPTYILGISAFYHDSAACLVKDGNIIAAAQEERFTRTKHDQGFPANAIRFCLAHAGITIGDVAHVAFYDKPFLKFERLLSTYVAYAPRGLRSFLKAMPIWLNQKLYLKDSIHKELNFHGDLYFMEHHESHAASAFYPSPFERAAFLTMDGVGEWTTTSFGVGKGSELAIQAELSFPHSLGLLYSAFTYFTGFRVNSGEYKLMGLAPYGEPVYADLIRRELIDIKDDGSFKLNMAYFNYCAGLTMTNKKFDRLFGGPPRRAETRITKREMDLARSIQDVTEEIMLKSARHVHAVTNEENLCLAGGVALNCVGNGRVLREGPFKNIWIQPAAGDAGGALGAALFVWYRILGSERIRDNVHDHQHGSYLGPDIENEAVRRLMTEHGAVGEWCDESALPRKVAELIRDQQVVGFVEGRMEFGPRALGARSILGDARSDKMQEVMNVKIKFRESFRPFAPSVLEEKCSDYFGLTVPSPYMLLVAPVAEQVIAQASRTDAHRGLEKLKVRRSAIPAVTHVDYSARVQTVSRDSNPLFHQVLDAFDTLTKCPVLINTSFNIRGEPIVCTAEDAYRCFMVTNMDYLVMGNFIFDKRRQPHKDHYKREAITQELD